MGHRRGQGDKIAQAPHSPRVQHVVPPQRGHAPDRVVRWLRGALGSVGGGGTCVRRNITCLPVVGWGENRVALVVCGGLYFALDTGEVGGTKAF